MIDFDEREPERYDDPRVCGAHEFVESDREEADDYRRSKEPRGRVVLFTEHSINECRVWNTIESDR